MNQTIEWAHVVTLVQEMVDDAVLTAERADEGADHVIFTATMASGARFVVKIGPDADTDACVLTLLDGCGVPVPRCVAQRDIEWDGAVSHVVVMTLVNGMPLSRLPRYSKHRYIAQVIDAMHRAHRVPSPGGTGRVLDVRRGRSLDWPDFLWRRLYAEDKELSWAAVFAGGAVDRGLIDRALAHAAARLERLAPGESGLLHCDLNQSNILVRDGMLSGIVDWSEAAYGDPLFDFARLRLNIVHRMDDAALQAYYAALDLSAEAIETEDTYYLLWLLEYVNLYTFYGEEAMVARQMDLLRSLGEQMPL